MAAKAAVDREKTVAITDFDSAPRGRNAKTSAPRAQLARTAVVGMRGTRGSRNLPAFEPCNPPELEPTNPTPLVPCVANQAAKPRMLKYGLSAAEIREEQRMEYARLGNTGLMVSELCLGCMTFGRETDEDTSREIVGRFLDAGGNFIDTADVYSKGISEEITGRAIKGVRDDVVLATKVFFPMGEDPNDVGLSRKHVTQGCEDSLRRLGTDYIDLYQVHCWDGATPLKETLWALTDLVRSGKVRYIGVSNFTGWQLMKSVCMSEANGFERFVCLQPQYSLVERNIEREILPICLEEGLGVIPWSPLGGGFLSGKYGRDKELPEGSRISEAVESMEEHWDRRATERNWATLDVVGRISEETGRSYAQISLNWLIRQEAVTAPIIGARTLEQLEDNIGASGWKLTGEQVEELSKASSLDDVYPYRFIRNAQRV
jgi:aryl-alcohol dehydrogenase-like predicted oxidoreductase